MLPPSTLIRWAFRIREGRRCIRVVAVRLSVDICFTHYISTLSIYFPLVGSIFSGYEFPIYRLSKEAYDGLRSDHF